MNLILIDHISHDVRPFLDDMGIKGPKTRYNNEVIYNGKGDMRRFVVEHIVTLDKVLCDMERASLTIHGSKLQLLCIQMKIIGYLPTHKVDIQMQLAFRSLRIGQSPP
jgi:hypothetical protein